MKNKLLFLLKYYVFWLAFAIVAKIVFLIYQGSESMTLTGNDYWMLFWKGLRMDLSFGGYIMMLSCVILTAGVFLPWRLVKCVMAGVNAVLLTICCLVVVADLEVFKNWGYHMDATALFYLKTPGDAMASTPTWLLLVLVLLCVVLFSVFDRAYHKWISPGLNAATGRPWHAFVFLLLGGAMLLPVRGGFNVAPMNVSFVFFNNKNMYANQAAINPVWNFLYEVMHVDKLKGDYHYMDDERARYLMDSLYVRRDSFPRVLTTERPNVVVLLLETFTLNAWNDMPNLQKIAREGIFFSNVYATGNRSDRGMLGVISGFPAHPKVSMLKYPNKTYEHPRFPVDFEALGYSTCFYYTGDINFGGFRSYATMSFQRLVTEDDFSGEAIQNRFKWGVHDEYMFDRLAEDLRAAPRPFMYMAFTLSSHEPFTVPMATVVSGEDSGSKLRNSIVYTDRCLGEFFERMKRSGIWDNTLFVLIADHGTRHVGQLQPYVPEAYRIPMIFTGGVLAVRDTVVDKIGSQTDMVATLYAQLGMDASAFRYSKNLLDPSALPFAYYAYSNAAAVVNGQGAYIFDLRTGKNLGTNNDPRMGELVKAYLQVLDSDFKEN